jgi:hypothetical protein
VDRRLRGVLERQCQRELEAYVVAESIQAVEDSSYVVVEASEGVAALSVSPSTVSTSSVSESSPSFLQSMEVLLTTFMEVCVWSGCTVGELLHIVCVLYVVTMMLDAERRGCREAAVAW